MRNTNRRTLYFTLLSAAARDYKKLISENYRVDLYTVRQSNASYHEITETITVIRCMY